MKLLASIRACITALDLADETQKLIVSARTLNEARKTVKEQWKTLQDLHEEIKRRDE